MSDQIQWGVLVTLPNGAPDVEECSTRSHALTVASSINRRTPDAAKVVYRTVKYGEWGTDHGDGDRQWAVRAEWADGHVEHEIADTRRRAEALTRNPHIDHVRTVASRSVQVSDWWLAAVAA